MAIAILSERYNSRPFSNSTSGGLSQLRDGVISLPLAQKARDVINTARELTPRYKQEQLEYSQSTADLEGFLRIVESPNAFITVDNVSPNHVRLGIYNRSNGESIFNLGAIQIQPGTRDQGPKATFSSWMFQDANGEPEALLHLSQQEPAGQSLVTQEGFLHQSRPRQDQRRYFSHDSLDVLANTTPMLQQQYAGSLYAFLNKVRLLTSQAFHQYDHGTVEKSALTALLTLSGGALKDAIQNSGVHAAIRPQRSEETNLFALSHDQVRVIQTLYKKGWTQPDEQSAQGIPRVAKLRDYKQPITGGMMISSRDGITHYVISAADNTYLFSGSKLLLPRWNNGTIEMVSPTDPDGQGIPALPYSKIPDDRTASMLRAIGERLREEESDRRALHDAVTDPGRIRSIPRPTQQTPTQPQIYAAARTAMRPALPTAYSPQPPARAPYLCLVPDISSPSLPTGAIQRVTVPLPQSRSSHSLPPVARPTTAVMNPIMAPKIVTPFTLAEAEEYLRTYKAPAPIIPLFQTPQKTGDYITGATLVNDQNLKAGLRARFRTLGVMPMPPIIYEGHEPEFPLTAAEVIARRPVVRRPLREHQRHVPQPRYPNIPQQI